MLNYEVLCSQLRALIADIPYPIANLANASALISQTIDRLNWAGFYLVQDNQLVLGPFQGKTACILIPIGKGVCGAAAKSGKTQLVPNVHEFPGHIACDSASNSELVVPIHLNGKLVGVLDLDSPELERFTEADRIGFEQFVSVLEQEFEKANIEMEGLV